MKARICIFFILLAGLAMLAACGLDEEMDAFMADATPINGYWLSDAGSGRADDLYARVDVAFFFDVTQKKYFSDDPFLGGGEFPFTVRKQDGDVYYLTMKGYGVTLWLMDSDTALMIVEENQRVIPMTRQHRRGQMAGAYER